MAQEIATPIAGASRLASLDLLRLLAIALVLGRHMEAPPSDLPGPFKAGFDTWLNFGGLGVDLFFVLSGFLVSGLLFTEYQKHGEISVKRFYLRRGWKIYPAFYFLLAFTYAGHWLLHGTKIRDRPFFSELLFIQSYQAGYWNHTWSLAVEEHFYVLLPLLLLFLCRRNVGAKDPFRAVPYLVVATAIVLLGVRGINFWLRSDYSFRTHVFATHLRLDSLFFGVLVGYAYHFHRDWFLRAFRSWRYAWIALGAALLSNLAFTIDPESWYIHTFGFAQYYLGSAALLVGVLMCQIPRNRLVVALAALGAYSYSIYLWHMALPYWLMPYLRDSGISWPVRTAIYMSGALVIGVAMAKLLELPLLKLRDRMYPSRSAELRVPARLESADGGQLRRAA